MSIETVRTAIDAAAAKASIKANEAQEIVSAATFGQDGKRLTPVTAGEMGKVADLFDRLSVATDRCSPSKEVTPDRMAARIVGTFLSAHGVQSEALLANQVRSALDQQELGKPRIIAPNLRFMTPLVLSDDRCHGGVRKEAFVDASSGRFFVKTLRSGRCRAKYFGPMNLADAPKPIGIALRNMIVNAINTAESEPSTPFSGELDSSLQRGQRVEIGALPHSGSFRYTAYLPEGLSDPNAATHAYIVRSGGLSGETMAKRVELTDRTAPSKVAFEPACSASDGPVVCSLEQQLVDAIFRSEPLRVLEARDYSGDNDGRKDFATRRLVTYEDAKGQMSEKVFEEWLILNPGLENETRFRGVMVKTDDRSNVYKLLWYDNAPDSPLAPIQINASHPRQNEIYVDFKNGRPAFDIHYDYSSTDVGATRGYYVYGEDRVTIRKYKPLVSEDGKSLVIGKNGRPVEAEFDEELFYEYGAPRPRPE
ncbi:MAG: hypothetical protein AAF735_04230 [Myxococcota bacterium]